MTLLSDQRREGTRRRMTRGVSVDHPARGIAIVAAVALEQPTVRGVLVAGRFVAVGAELAVTVVALTHRHWWSTASTTRSDSGANTSTHTPESSGAVDDVTPAQLRALAARLARTLDTALANGRDIRAGPLSRAVNDLTRAAERLASLPVNLGEIEAKYGQRSCS